MNYVTLAKELLRAMRAHRSQRGLSRRLRYRSNVIAAWESGRRWPTACQLFGLADRTGIEVNAALQQFYGTPEPWIADLDLSTTAGVATLLRHMRGLVPMESIAQQLNCSRSTISRWLAGQTQPRLPEFLHFVDASTLRLLDLLSLLVPMAKLPSASVLWQQLELRRELAYNTPWSQAVIRALELRDYQRLPRHRPGWIAKRVGISPTMEQEALERLAAAGEIHWLDTRWVLAPVQTVDTGRDRRAERRLRGWCAETGVKKIEANASGLFSFNIFTVSDEEMEEIQRLHLEYYRHLRAIAGRSQRADRVLIANVQLFEAGGG